VPRAVPRDPEPPSAPTTGTVNGTLLGGAEVLASGEYFLLDVQLWSDGAVVAETPILADGTYRLDAVSPGDYTVKVHALWCTNPSPDHPLVCLTKPKDGSEPVPRDPIEFWFHSSWFLGGDTAITVVAGETLVPSLWFPTFGG
jgi:hypothetical protein